MQNTLACHRLSTIIPFRTSLQSLVVISRSDCAVSEDATYGDGLDADFCTTLVGLMAQDHAQDFPLSVV